MISSVSLQHYFTTPQQDTSHSFLADQTSAQSEDRIAHIVTHFLLLDS